MDESNARTLHLFFLFSFDYLALTFKAVEAVPTDAKTASSDWWERRWKKERLPIDSRSKDRFVAIVVNAFRPFSHHNQSTESHKRRIDRSVPGELRLATDWQANSILSHNLFHLSPQPNSSSLLTRPFCPSIQSVPEQQIKDGHRDK